LGRGGKLFFFSHRFRAIGSGFFSN
jgi:hypothetical protein